MQKNDSFQPRRSTSIDGFFAKPGVNRPRQPIFRSQLANGAGLQAQPITPTDMPRNNIQPTIAGGDVPVSTGLPQPILGSEPRRRSRGHGKPAAKKHWNWRRIAKRTGLIFGALVLVFGLWFGFKFYRNIANLTGNNNPFSLLGAFRPSHLQNQDGRVNILVAGNSADDTGHNGAQLTDSIMILSIDTRTNTAFMISIPRDLWVNIPGDGHSKINAVYPSGGMKLLQRTIQANLNIPINYYALVNYTAFRDLVNAVGGISITIKSPDKRGIYDPSLDYTTRYCCALAKYPNGPVTLNGKQALNLARARGDAYGSYGFPQADFDRTQHQRQMLMAIKDKVSNTSLFTNPLEISRLVDAVGNNVKTNLSVGEIETLYSYSKKLNDNNIQSLNINTLAGSEKMMLTSYASPDGQSALIPAVGLDDFSDIQAQIARLLSSNPLAREAADLVLLNATDTVGLAKTQEGILARQGINVAFIADAPATQKITTIIDNSGGKKPMTLAALKKTYNATVVTNASLSAKYPNAEFIVLLGANTVPSTSAR